MPDKNWQTYYELSKGFKPRPLLVKALQFAKVRDEALDLGPGAFNDVKYLVTEGFRRVTAVDSQRLAQDVIDAFPKGVVSYVISTFEDFDFPKSKYDLVNAQYSLPFNPKESFNRVFGSIIDSLKPGGVFVGQLFGTHDEWNAIGRPMTFHTKEEVETLLDGIKVVEFKEEEKDENTAAGVVKHWHIFHFIVIM